MARWWRAAAAGGLKTAALSSPPPPVRPPPSSSYHTIQAIPRECSGSRVASRDRAQGRIPTVVFAQGLLEKDPGARSPSRKYLLTTERKQIKSILSSVRLPFFCSTTFGLQIRAGSGSSTLLESGKVLPVKVHRDEETGKILNLVLVWADEGSKLKVDVPVAFKGEEVCPGLKKEHIPSKIEVDVSNLDIGDRIFMRDVEFHPSMELLSKNDAIPICKVMSTKSESAEPAVV
ncbi:hypothetical protein EUGRSUZ_I00975 [Eucalyptus grandis]|uniref:Uncharacterized protein n=2 Tax=Eucalyptus grandis TaxID=71139 RepID=A0ACC3JDB1_EUCGR|nr:hypothetical protein EUGRSUZ_I00975 [Eucalyptus grandis]